MQKINSQEYQKIFEQLSVSKQIAKVNKLIAKWNKVKGQSLYLEDNRIDSHKVNWAVVEQDGQKIPFDYDNRLWVIALRFECGYHGITITV